MELRGIEGVMKETTSTLVGNKSPIARSFLLRPSDSIAEETYRYRRRFVHLAAGNVLVVVIFICSMGVRYPWSN